MIRLLPRSLFGRLILVLSSGLIVAQLLSAAINFAERDALLLRTTGLQSAERIAGIVKLLDSLNASERKRIVALLNFPPQVVTLDLEPTIGDDDATTKTPQALLFAAILHQSLDDDEHHIRVAERATPTQLTPPGRGYGRRRAMLEGKEFVPGMYREEHWQTGGTFLMTQVRLDDGHWVTFDTTIPREVANLPLRLVLTLAVLLISVLVLAFIAVRWITRPLKLLASAADELGRDLNRAPLPENGPVELQRAARAFNAMQLRLQSYLRERTRLLAAMSHDLKTPITRMRLRSEMLDDEPLRARFEKDLGEMEAMVAGTLDFMRGLDSREAAQPIDVMALLESLQADYAEAGQTVEITGLATAPFVGMAALLRRCLGNLLDNAILYGGQAEIVIEDDAEFLILRIRDRGPGIDKKEQEKVFEPFYRIEASRNRETGGTGLGLTIARGIVQAHGGDIALANRSEGGLEVTLTLPRRNAAG
ncbi:MAG: ATP-binding protein [Betaproteobacteria bacterium]